MATDPRASAASGPEVGANEDEPYVISEERLNEIRGLLAPPWEQTAHQTIPRFDVTVYDLAAAVEDLLAERDDRG